MITQERANEIGREVATEVFGSAPGYFSCALGDSATEESVRIQLRQSMEDFRDGKCSPLEGL